MTVGKVTSMNTPASQTALAGRRHRGRAVARQARGELPNRHRPGAPRRDCCTPSLRGAGSIAEKEQNNGIAE